MRWRFRVPLLLAVAAAALYLLAAAGRDFWSPDEPDFAEHVREMNERGSWLLPYENGRPYSEKPILFYWAVASTTVISGGDVHPLATRLPSVLAGAFLVFGAASLSGRRGGDREALLAGAMTATSPILFWQAQFLQIDAMFSALLFACFVAQLMIEDDPERAARWRWGLHLLLPLAVLTKGPLAVVLVGLVALVKAAASRSWRPVAELAPLRGAAVLAITTVPWYILAARAGGPEYAYDLIVNQNWNRFFHAFDHVQPWWFYLESIWSDFFPWTVLALAAPLVLKGSGLFRERPELQFSGLVAATVLVFLSISQAKQGKYLLVAYPFAAVLVAAAVQSLEERRRRGLPADGLRYLRSYALLVSGMLLGAALALGPVARSRAPKWARLAPRVAWPLGVGAVGTGAILLRRRREAAPAFLALAAALGAGEAAVGAAVLPAFDVLKTGRPFYERIRPLVSHGEPLAYYGGTYHCYPILVLRRRTEDFRTEDELAAWLQRTPGAFVLADRSESRHWKNPALLALRVADRQRVGGDEALLLREP